MILICGELARTAGLLLVRVAVLDALRDLLAESHLRRADIGIDLVGPLENVDLDVEMQFAHPLEDGLAALLIGGNAERRILGGELGQRDAELFLVGLRFRLDRDLDDRIGEFHLLEDHRLLRIAQRVAGAHFLEARQSDDVAGIGFLDVFAVVRMHQQHAADPFLALFRRVDHAGAAGERAGIDAAEGDRADKGIVHDLEREQRQRRVVLRLADDVFIVVGIDAVNRRHVERARQIINHRVEQRLHTLVLERGAAQYGKERAGDYGLADAAF